MCNSPTKGLIAALLMLSFACGGDNEEFRFGFNATGIEFVFFSENEGIHPSRDTLQNPNNPFREFAIGEDTKFDILDGAGNAGAFYGLAVALAGQPTGENQFFVASKLRDLALSGEVAEEDQKTVREMAIAAFQRVLDCFPDSQLYDVTGTFPRKLATPAYLQILDLGGAVEGDWTLTHNSDGEPQAIRGTGSSAIARELLCFP